jgi:soluble lytic murein transglycosylase-like protein
MASAGGYWAYRAAIQLRKPDDAIGYLKIARQYRHTFYGILAARALGEDMPFQWQHLAYDNPQGYAETVQKLPTWARHVKALLEVGETDRAEDALRANYPYKTPNESLLAQSLASIGNMAGLAMRMAALSRDMALDDAYYPRPEWSPLDAWRLTSDLVFAFARQESGFNPKARSYVGARGVMQLMPATARFVRKKLPDQLAKGSLFDPNYNVTLGQKYIEMLMDDPIVGENLFYLPIAYNAGPGNLQKWQQRVPHHDDPLLFIESMPSRETRHFLKRVITNYWAYKDQAGLPTPTVDQVLQGKWPHYVIPNKPPANNVQNQPADQPQSKAELHAVSIE